MSIRLTVALAVAASLLTGVGLVYLYQAMQVQVHVEEPGWRAEERDATRHLQDYLSQPQPDREAYQPQGSMPRIGRGMPAP